MTFDADKLRALDEAATTGDLSTAERHIKHEHIECPICQGDGEVLATDYCNIDSKALGVQFYGIGNEFGAHEALWTYLRHSVPAILAMAEDRKAWAEAVATIMARCEAMEDEAVEELVKAEAEHAQGYWRGQKRTAKSIRRELHDLTRALRSGEREGVKPKP